MTTTTTLRRYPELCGSEVIHASFAARAFAPHTHDTWTIGLVEQGANRFRRERTAWIADAGMVCVVNPGEVHTGGGAAMTYSDLMPSAALLAQAFPQTPIAHLFLKDAVFAQGPAVAAIRQMFATLAGPCGPVAREQAVIEGLAVLFMSAHRLAAGDRRCDRQPRAAHLAQEYIEANLHQSVSLASLAALTGLSMFHFCRVFEAALGMPPAAYLRNRRVQRARQLISKGCALADAAAMAGFADQSHMTRLFRSMLGASPAQWRP